MARRRRGNVRQKSQGLSPAMLGQPVAVGGHPQFRPFKPYVPPPPPTGSFDPALDAQLGQAQRGLGDLRQDVATGNLRAGVDYGLGREDLTRGRDRGYADIDLAQGRGVEDYGTQTQALSRSYSQLQRRQAEGARAAGVLSGGIALQAAAKRAENQGIEQRGLDTARDRMLADSALARTRLGQDTDLGLGQLTLGYGRDMTDRGQQLTRAEREGTQFGLDIDVQKGFQASQAGYVPPKGPKNQGVNRHGVPYREKRVGRWIYRYDKTGKVLSKRKAK